MRLVFAPGKFSISSILLALGILATLASDAGFAVTALEGTYATGHLLDAGWLLTYVLDGAAVLHPSASKRSAHVNSNVSTLPGQRLALLAAASMMSPAVLIVEGSGTTRSTTSSLEGARRRFSYSYSFAWPASSARCGRRPPN